MIRPERCLPKEATASTPAVRGLGEADEPEDVLSGAFRLRLGLPSPHRKMSWHLSWMILLYKQRSPPVPHVLMDPWNETTVAHAREFDVPELDHMFPGFDRVTLPQRLAAILGGEALNDPVPRPLHPSDALGPRYRTSKSLFRL